VFVFVTGLTGVRLFSLAVGCQFVKSLLRIVSLLLPEFGTDTSDDVQSDASETNDMSEVSKVSTISVRSTQSGRPCKFR